MRFSWDSAKARANHAWHGVAFTEAMTVFADLAAIDERNYNHPERRVLIGMSARARILFVSFSEEAEDAIRIISARPASPVQRKRYADE